MGGASQPAGGHCAWDRSGELLSLHSLCRRHRTDGQLGLRPLRVPLWRRAQGSLEETRVVQELQARVCADPGAASGWNDFVQHDHARHYRKVREAEPVPKGNAEGTERAKVLKGSSGLTSSTVY